MECLFAGLSSQEAANLGNFLTGIATVGAVLVACYQLDHWRRQQIKSKRAEVAGRTLNAVIRLFQAITFLTSSRIDSPKDPEQEEGLQKKTYQIRRDHEDRIKATAQDLDAFFNAKNEAEVYLTDEINKKLEELWKEWVSVRVEISIYFNGVDAHETKLSHVKDAYNNSFGTIGQKRREAMEDKIKTLLKPIARLES